MLQPRRGTKIPPSRTKTWEAEIDEDLMIRRLHVTKTPEILLADYFQSLSSTADNKITSAWVVCWPEIWPATSRKSGYGMLIDATTGILQLFQRLALHVSASKGMQCEPGNVHQATVCGVRSGQDLEFIVSPCNHYPNFQGILVKLVTVILLVAEHPLRN